MKFLMRFLAKSTDASNASLNDCENRENPVAPGVGRASATGNTDFMEGFDGFHSALSPHGFSAALLQPPNICLTEQDQRIRLLSQETDAAKVVRALRRVRPELKISLQDRLELALVMALLDQVMVTETLLETHSQIGGEP